MKIKVHDFEVHGGNVIKRGKSNWPDCLNISIPRWHAFNLLQQLSIVLQNEDESINLNFMGKLDCDIKEE